MKNQCKCSNKVEDKSWLNSPSWAKRAVYYWLMSVAGGIIVYIGLILVFIAIAFIFGFIGAMFGLL